MRGNTAAPARSGRDSARTQSYCGRAAAQVSGRYGRSGDMSVTGKSEVTTKSKNRISVLFVCMGNICRSPTAEGVLRQLIATEAADLEVTIDSAGTHGYHIGASPDPRSQAAARRRGIDLGGLRARRLVAADFERFDYVLVMDGQNYADANEIAPVHYRAIFRRFMDYAPETGRSEVPDPYYGDASGFDQVLDLTEVASRGLLKSLRARGARSDGR